MMFNLTFPPPFNSRRFWYLMLIIITMVLTDYFPNVFHPIWLQIVEVFAGTSITYLTIDKFNIPKE